MNDCVFCKIVNGKKTEERIYENKNFLAFLDLSPINPGHTLLISKEHYENIFMMPDSLLAEYIILIKNLGKKIKKAMNARWINILIFGEEIKHAHVHIVPRFNNDNFRYPTQGKYKEGEEALIIKKIKSEK